MLSSEWVRMAWPGLAIPWVIGGPSGVGKSSFCHFMESRGWLHLETDIHPEDGMIQLKLLEPWTALVEELNPQPLVKFLQTHAKGRRGVVMSLSSCLAPPVEALRQSRGLLKFAFLHGVEQTCLEAFVEREKESGRNLPESHWHLNNRQILSALADPGYQPYLVEAFHPDGSRKSCEELFRSISESGRLR